MRGQETRVLIVLAAVLTVASAAGLLESLLSWEDGLSAGSGHQNSGLTSQLLATPPVSPSAPILPQARCLCQTLSCLCCVDLNLTATIDLGGSACVNIQQKEQNVSLNLNYGDNPIHNATIKLEEAAGKPTCMNLLSDLAQVCARFTSMKQSTQNSGHDGCLVIEPALLSTPQATFHMGCFNFNGVVRQIENPVIEPVSDVQNTQENPDEEEEGLNADELISAVSATAEQGIALFSQWLGLNLSPRPQQPQRPQASTPAVNTQSSESTQAVNDSTRLSRNLNLAPLISEPEQVKSEELRFKELLSAQDNILKGSATIGQPISIPTTFLYSKPSKTEEQEKDKQIAANGSPSSVTISQENLAVVPRESRRGGRAYDIHRHVNEI